MGSIFMGKMGGHGFYFLGIMIMGNTNIEIRVPVRCSLWKENGVY